MTLPLGPRELGRALDGKAGPGVDVHGEVPVGTYQIVTRSRVIITESQDVFAPPPSVANQNPRQLYVCGAGFDLQIDAVSNRPGAVPQDHRDLAREIRNACMRELYLWAQQSGTTIAFAGGSFTKPADPATVEQHAEYHLGAVVADSVVDAPWLEVEGVTADGSAVFHFINGESETVCP